MAIVAEIKSGSEFKGVGGQAFYTDGPPDTARVGIEIGTYARLGIKIPCVGDRPIIQYFVIAVAHTGAVGESFGFDPQTVPVCADPAFAVPAELIPSAVAAAFELIE